MEIPFISIRKNVNHFPHRQIVRVNGSSSYRRIFDCSHWKKNILNFRVKISSLHGNTIVLFQGWITHEPRWTVNSGNVNVFCSVHKELNVRNELNESMIDGNNSKWGVRFNQSVSLWKAVASFYPEHCYTCDGQFGTFFLMTRNRVNLFSEIAP